MRGAREVGPRLNKATLLSWLVFAYSLSVVREQLAPEFIGRFEDSRRAAKRRGEPELTAFFVVYNDRASYRVNDTLSILLRDLVLNVAFSEWRARPIREELDGLLRQLETSRNAIEPRLVAFIEATGWDIPT